MRDIGAIAIAMAMLAAFVLLNESSRPPPAKRARFIVVLLCPAALTWGLASGWSGEPRPWLAALSVVVFIAWVTIPPHRELRERRKAGDSLRDDPPVVFLRPFRRDRERNIHDEGLHFVRSTVGYRGLLITAALVWLASRSSNSTALWMIAALVLAASVFSLLRGRIEPRTLGTGFALAARDRLGPVWCVSQPGGIWEPGGPSRLLPDRVGANWQEVVTWLVTHGRVVVVLAGQTTALSWELECARGNTDPGRIFVVSDLLRDHQDHEWDAIASSLEMAGYVPPNIPFLPRGSLIGFDERGRGSLLAQQLERESNYVDVIEARLRERERDLPPKGPVKVAEGPWPSLPSEISTQHSSLGARMRALRTDRLGRRFAITASILGALIGMASAATVALGVVAPWLALAILVECER